MTISKLNSLKSLRKATLAAVLGLRHTQASTALAKALRAGTNVSDVVPYLSYIFPMHAGGLAAFAWKNYLAAEVVSRAKLTREMHMRLAAELVPSMRLELSAKTADTPINWAARVVSALGRVTVLDRNAPGMVSVQVVPQVKKIRRAKPKKFKKRFFTKLKPSARKYILPTTFSRLADAESVGTEYRSSATRQKTILLGKATAGAFNKLQKTEPREFSIQNKRRARSRPTKLTFRMLAQAAGVSVFGVLPFQDRIRELSESVVTPPAQVAKAIRRTSFRHFDALVARAAREVVPSYNRPGLGGVRLGAPHMSHFGWHLGAKRTGLEGYGQPLGISATPTRMIAALLRTRVFNPMYAAKFGYPQAYLTPYRHTTDLHLFREERQIMAMLAWNPANRNYGVARLGGERTPKELVELAESFCKRGATHAFSRLRRGFKKLRGVIRRKRWMFRRRRGLSWTHGYSPERASQFWWNRRLSGRKHRGSAPGWLLTNHNSFYRTRQSRIHYFRHQPYFKRRYRDFERRDERRGGFGDEVWRKQSRAKAYFGAGHVGAFAPCALSIVLAPYRAGPSRRRFSRGLRDSLYALKTRRRRFGKLTGGRGFRKYLKKKRLLKRLKRDARTKRFKWMSRLPFNATVAPISGFFKSVVMPRTTGILDSVKQFRATGFVTKGVKRLVDRKFKVALSRALFSDQITPKSDVDRGMRLRRAAQARAKKRWEAFPFMRRKYVRKLEREKSKRDRASAKWWRLISHRSSELSRQRATAGISPVAVDGLLISGKSGTSRQARKLVARRPASSILSRRRGFKFTTFPKFKAFNTVAFNNRRQIRRVSALMKISASAATLDQALLAINNPRARTPRDIVQVSSMLVSYARALSGPPAAIQPAWGTLDYFTFASPEDQRKHVTPTGTCYMPLVLISETMHR